MRNRRLKFWKTKWAKMRKRIDIGICLWTCLPPSLLCMWTSAGRLPHIRLIHIVNGLFHLLYTYALALYISFSLSINSSKKFSNNSSTFGTSAKNFNFVAKNGSHTHTHANTKAAADTAALWLYRWHSFYELIILSKKDADCRNFNAVYELEPWAIMWYHIALRYRMNQIEICSPLRVSSYEILCVMSMIMPS